MVVTGELDHERSIELGPKTRDGQLGYHVFTPLKRGEGQDTILVNRGFVKREFRDPKSRPASLVSRALPPGALANWFLTIEMGGTTVWRYGLSRRHAASSGAAELVHPGEQAREGRVGVLGH